MSARDPLRSHSCGDGFDAFELLEMLRGPAEVEGQTVRATTPHGSYTFAVVGLDEFDNGDVLLRLREVTS